MCNGVSDLALLGIIPGASICMILCMSCCMDEKPLNRRRKINLTRVPRNPEKMKR